MSTSSSTERLPLLLSAVAGFGMLIWIFVELAMMQQFSWLQAAYFILGELESRAPTHRWRRRTRA